MRYRFYPLAVAMLIAGTGPVLGQDDERAVRQFAQRYYTAYAAQDVDTLVALWSPRAEAERAAWRKATLERFSEVRNIAVANFAVRTATVTGDTARVRVVALLQAIERRTGQRVNLGTPHRVLSLARAAGTWRLTRLLPAQEALAEDLATTADRAARSRLVRAERELHSPDLVRELNDACYEHARNGRFAAAERLNDAASEIAAMLNDGAARGWCLFYRGLIDDARSEPEAALASFLRAVTQFQESRELNGVAAALNRAGSAYADLGRYTEAVTNHEASLTLARALGDKLAEADALNNLAIIFELTGRPIKAMEYFQASLETAIALRNRAGEVSARTGLGNVNAEAGRYPEALREHEAALAISRELKDAEGEAVARGNIANINADLGRYADALREYEAALAIFRRLGQRAREAATLDNIGTIYRVTAQVTEARRQYEAALALRRTIKDLPGEVACHNNLGALFMDQNKFAEANSAYQAALAAARTVGNRRSETTILTNLANLARLSGEAKEALALARDALQMARDLGSGALESRADFEMGLACSALTRDAEALAHLRSALAIADADGNREDAQTFQAALGDFHRDRKQWRPAADAYRRSIGHLEQMRAAAGTPGLRAGLLERNSAPYFRLTDCLLHENDLAGALAVAESGKGRVLLDLIQGGKVLLRKGMTPAERQEEQERLDRLAALGAERNALSARKGDRQRIADLDQQLADARAAYDRFRESLYLKHPEIKTRRADFAPATLVTLNRTLFARAPGLVVLSYLMGRDDLFIFVLTRGPDPNGPAGLAAHRVPVGFSRLMEMVGEFYDACLNREAGRPVSPELYQWLLAPAADALTKAQHLVIVPDGSLQALPFQALRQSEDRSYLVERCSISYASSLTALVEMAQLADQRRQARTGGNLLVVGRPAFGPGQADLPASETEARQVAALYGPRADLLLGAKADKATVLAHLADKRLVHLATHGLVNEVAPFYSSIALAATSRDDGQLYARELLDLDVRSDLVVLSACQTALGRVTRCEGIVGLAWAWFAAGAPSTVVSQWKVGDESTQTLMVEFHRRLAAGATKAEALRQAQIALLKAGKWRHPFYWAPFILIGDWDR